jgi:hypothetical protein
MTAPASTLPDTPMTPDMVSARATVVLEANWRTSHTVPASGLYPHQWSWDSSFIAIGLSLVSPRRAGQEMDALFAGQWRDGRLPQIIFDPHRDQDSRMLQRERRPQVSYSHRTMPGRCGRSTKQTRWSRAVDLSWHVATPNWWTGTATCPGDGIVARRAWRA